MRYNEIKESKLYIMLAPSNEAIVVKLINGKLYYGKNYEKEVYHFNPSECRFTEYVRYINFGEAVDHMQSCGVAIYDNTEYVILDDEHIVYKDTGEVAWFSAVMALSNKWQKK